MASPKSHQNGQRAAIYARVATTAQAGPSPLAAQVQACQAYCAERGYQIIGRYEDAGASGATPYREGYARLLRDVATGAIDVVVCTDASRLGRTGSTLQRAVTMAEGASVPIETLSGETPA